MKFLKRAAIALSIVLLTLGVLGLTGGTGLIVFLGTNALGAGLGFALYSIISHFILEDNLSGKKNEVVKTPSEAKNVTKSNVSMGTVSNIPAAIATPAPVDLTTEDEDILRDESFNGVQPIVSPAPVTANDEANRAAFYAQRDSLRAEITRLIADNFPNSNFQTSWNNMNRGIEEGSDLERTLDCYLGKPDIKSKGQDIVEKIRSKFNELKELLKNNKFIKKEEQQKDLTVTQNNKQEIEDAEQRDARTGGLLGVMRFK